MPAFEVVIKTVTIQTTVTLTRIYSPPPALEAERLRASKARARSRSRARLPREGGPAHGEPAAEAALSRAGSPGGRHGLRPQDTFMRRPQAGRLRGGRCVAGEVATS